MSGSEPGQRHDRTHSPIKTSAAWWTGCVSPCPSPPSAAQRNCRVFEGFSLKRVASFAGVSLVTPTVSLELRGTVCLWPGHGQRFCPCLLISTRGRGQSPCFHEQGSEGQTALKVAACLELDTETGT